MLIFSIRASQYCSMLYSNITVVGAHNSYTASNTNLAANQDYGGGFHFHDLVTVSPPDLGNRSQSPNS